MDYTDHEAHFLNGVRRNTSVMPDKGMLLHVSLPDKGMLLPVRLADKGMLLPVRLAKPTDMPRSDQYGESPPPPPPHSLWLGKKDK